MATYNILTAHTSGPTQQLMGSGDSLYLAKSGTLNSLGADGAKSSGGDNDLQIHGTLAGGSSAFFGTFGGDLIQVYANGTVLGGVVSAITVDGTGSNTFSNAGSVSTHTTTENVSVVDLEGDNNHVTNSGSITANQNGTGVVLDGGSNTLNNSGSITAGTDGHNFASGDGVFIAEGGGDGDNGGDGGGHSRGEPIIFQSIVNSGSITALNGDGVLVEGDGENDLSNATAGVINGSHNGVELDGSFNMVTNAGSITGGFGVTAGADQTGLYIDGSFNSVQNSGVIAGSSGVYLDGGDNHVTNATHGTISGGSSSDDGHNGLTITDGDNDIVNRGTIVGGSTGIHVDGGDNNLFNAKAAHITGQGAFDTAVYMDGGDNTIQNHGHINGGIDGNGISLDGGSNTVSNTGVIADSVSSDETTGAAAFEANGSHNVLTNDGTIKMDLGSDVDDFDNAAVYISGGDNTITNGHHGSITDGNAGDLGNAAIDFGDGGNTVTNNGHITGTVYLGGDTSDSFNGGHGHFVGTIYGGEASDAIEVGKGMSTIVGGDGADFLQAGAGQNTFQYDAVSNSYGAGATHFDTVDDFNAAHDSFGFAFDDDSSFDSADFATVGGAALTESNFDTDIKADVGNHLHANSAVLLQISGGEFAGDDFLIVDGNGQAGYQAGSDYVVELTNISGTLSASNIHAIFEV